MGNIYFYAQSCEFIIYSDFQWFYSFFINFYNFYNFIENPEKGVQICNQTPPGAGPVLDPQIAMFPGGYPSGPNSRIYGNRPNTLKRDQACPGAQGGVPGGGTV
jgi:hypothetical protein